VEQAALAWHAKSDSTPAYGFAGLTIEVRSYTIETRSGVRKRPQFCSAVSRP